MKTFNKNMVFMDYETTGIDTSIKTQDVPIQIGCIFTNRHLEIKEEYQSHIKWPKMNLWKEWPEKHMPAFKIHKISLETVKKYGLSPAKICKELKQVCSKFDPLPVIISDAPSFEMFWTKLIFENDTDRPTSFPFHYNAWSVYPLLQFDDISVDMKPHDAYEDALLLYKAVKKSYKMRQK